jgi:hypothetical protein
VHDTPLLKLRQSHEKLSENVLGELDPQQPRAVFLLGAPNTHHPRAPLVGVLPHIIITHQQRSVLLLSAAHAHITHTPGHHTHTHTHTHTHHPTARPPHTHITHQRRSDRALQSDGSPARCGKHTHHHPPAPLRSSQGATRHRPRSDRATSRLFRLIDFLSDTEGPSIQVLLGTVSRVIKKKGQIEPWKRIDGVATEGAFPGWRASHLDAKHLVELFAPTLSQEIFERLAFALRTPDPRHQKTT